MRIGFDIDGVLASFEHGAAPLLRRISGRDLFPADFPHFEPPVWDWPEHYGYTDAEVGLMWEIIAAQGTFWLNLPETDNMSTLRLLWKSLKGHDVYFITARPGATAKRQTELWLLDHLVLPVQGVKTEYAAKTPTVLISHHKGLCAAALSLDVYIDDRDVNAQSVAAQSPRTRMYLLNKPYNREFNEHSGIMRVDTLGEMFDFEGPNL